MPPISAPGPGGVVLACGLATLDVVQTVDAVPTANEKVVASDLLVAVGGPAANAAVTCAVLGVASRLLSRIGEGPLAAAMRADLAAHGVQVLDVAAPGSLPPVSTVLVTRGSGERAVVSVNATLATRGDVPDLADDVVVVLVDGHHLDLALAVAEQARRRGVPVLLDGGSWKPGLEALLALVDVAILSADFAIPGGGDALTDVRAMGPRIVAQSHGGAPIEVLWGPGAARGRTGPIQVPVPPVEVVDTLGAGDALHGALAAWAAAQEGGVPTDDPDPWLHGLAWAAGVASASCGAPGARGWVVDTAAVAEWRRDLAGR